GTGTTGSLFPGDTFVSIQCADGCVSEWPLTVVVPYALLPFDITQNVTGANKALNNSTVPSVVNPDPNDTNNDWELVTDYGPLITVTVVDRWGDTVGSLYNNSPISESGFPNHVDLDSNSTYPDPIGPAIPFDTLPASTSQTDATNAATTQPVKP